MRKWLEALICIPVLISGYGIYLVRGKTPALAYRSMVRLFCMTEGRSNDWLSRLIGLCARRYRLAGAKGLLGDMSDRRTLDPIIASLRAKGYYLFPHRLPDDLCDRLAKVATTRASVTYEMDGQATGQSQCVIYDPAHPRAVRYELRTEDLLAEPDIQRLMADLSFVAVAQEYLGARPVVDVLSMWWLTAFSKRPDSRAAQFFHFDMDRPKWLKFFIYLTDVTPSNGPHTYVAGSHRSGAIPKRLLHKGYARLTDEEVSAAFAPEDILEFCGPRGSILAEDTRGLHKGRHVEQGDRLMLQIQFSNTLFGADYPKVTYDGAAIPDLERTFRQYPKLYSAYR